MNGTLEIVFDGFSFSFDANASSFDEEQCEVPLSGVRKRIENVRSALLRE